MERMYLERNQHTCEPFSDNSFLLQDERKCKLALQTLLTVSTYNDIQNALFMELWRDLHSVSICSSDLSRSSIRFCAIVRTVFVIPCRGYPKPSVSRLGGQGCHQYTSRSFCREAQACDSTRQRQLCQNDEHLVQTKGIIRHLERNRSAKSPGVCMLGCSRINSRPCHF